MAKIYDISARKITRLQNYYPLVNIDAIPEKYQRIPITFRSDEIEKFDVIFFHRLMKRNYGAPSETECETTNEIMERFGIKRFILKRAENGFIFSLPSSEERKYEWIKGLEDGKIPVIGIEWRYFISTESGGIIQIGTKNQHTAISVSHVLQKKQIEHGSRIKKEGKKFITDLLKEAERVKGEILNPKKEFEKGENLQLYLLDNIYLHNYESAGSMLFSAVDHEQKLRDEFLKYPAEDYKDPEKDAYTDKFMLVCGMYFAASISYYYMALEGFVNLIYHAFLRDEFSDRELNLEQRLDLEQKIRLMPRLCCGFKNRHIDRKSDIFKNFKRLKNYRNKIFHSKIEDALKRMTFYENSFFYTCDMEKNQEHRFPSRKINLKIEDVLTVKSIVDKIVKEILSIMKEESRILTDQFIMKTVNVPFWKKETGKIALGNP